MGAATVTTSWAAFLEPVFDDPLLALPRLLVLRDPEAVLPLLCVGFFFLRAPFPAAADAEVAAVLPPFLLLDVEDIEACR